jgi:hypothetical protein
MMTSKMTTVMWLYLTYLARAVGNVGMSVAQLVENVNPVLAQVTEVLSIPWDRVKRITLHATKGPSFTVYTASHVPPARSQLDAPPDGTAAAQRSKKDKRENRFLRTNN